MIYANATLLSHLVNLYFDLAARVGTEVQTRVIYPAMKHFFSSFYSFYNQHKEDEKTETIFKSILISIKKQSVFKKQKTDPTLSFYSFELLELLRGTDIAGVPSPLR